LLLTIHGRQKGRITACDSIGRSAERSAGKNLIFDGLEKYIAQSEQTRGRTFHVTLTYFWIQMVHFGISSMPPLEGVSAPDTSSVQTLVAGEKPDDKPTSREDEKPNDHFVRFLLTNPHLADGNLLLFKPKQRF
jgi:hypothetical protein